MSENFDEILSTALSLSPGARAMLADHLLESLDSSIPVTASKSNRAMLADHLLESLDAEDQKRIDAIWAEEAERRMQEIRDGKVQPIDGELAMRELRTRRSR